LKKLISQIVLIFCILYILYSSNDVEFYNYAVFNYKNKNKTYAKEIYKQLISNSIKNVAFRSNFNLGCIYLDEKNYDSAIICFENSIKIDPFNYNAKYNYIYAKLKKENENAPENMINSSKNFVQQNKSINQKDILEIVKSKEEESRKKYINKLLIEAPKSKYPW